MGTQAATQRAAAQPVTQPAAQADSPEARQARETVAAVLAAVRRDGRGALTAPEGKRVADAYGIATPAEGLAADVDEAVALAHRFDGPVVLKIVSPDILHKSEAGGVVVGLETAAEIRAAFHR